MGTVSTDIRIKKSFELIMAEEWKGLRGSARAAVAAEALFAGGNPASPLPLAVRAPES